jgi:hypothetical protein
MDRDLRNLGKRIENLRNDMVLTFVHCGTDLSNPQVLHLSQLLDEQLNRYERCIRLGSAGKQVGAGTVRVQLENISLSTVS